MWDVRRHYVRLLVTGASGSGTTTLGKALAADLGFGFVDADELYWLATDPPFRQKRDEVQRRALLRERLAKHQAIVVSGSVMEWDAESEDSFDLIVFLQAPAQVRVSRLRARDLEQFGKVSEEFVAWAAQYDEGAMAGRSLPRHLAWLEKRGCPIIRLSSTRPVSELVSHVSQRLPRA
jgi:adenylate kinase family enzyme